MFALRRADPHPLSVYVSAAFQMLQEQIKKRLTVKKGCLVFFNTRLSVRVWATSSWWRKNRWFGYQSVVIHSTSDDCGVTKQGKRDGSDCETPRLKISENRTTQCKQTDSSRICLMKTKDFISFHIIANAVHSYD